LVSTSKLIDAVEQEIQIGLPKVQKGDRQFKAIFVENDKIALELINEYGPEHFIICTDLIIL
jgi:histidinol dehydrogenase